jgi:hypothetical protein
MAMMVLIGQGITDEIIPDRPNQEIVIRTAGKGLEDSFFDRNGLG